MVNVLNCANSRGGFRGEDPPLKTYLKNFLIVIFFKISGSAYFWFVAPLSKFLDSPLVSFVFDCFDKIVHQ